MIQTEVLIEIRIECIIILAVELVGNQAKPFTETLEVDDLPCAEVFDRICNLLILHQAENVVIGGAGFLLCSQIFRQVGDGIALGLELTGIEGDTSCSLGPDRSCVVNIVRSEACGLQFLCGETFGKLLDDRGHDLKVCQLLRTY